MMLKCRQNRWSLVPGLIAAQYPIEPQIGERISKRLINYIKGMLSNLQTQHDLKFSDPNQLFAEVVFTLTVFVKRVVASNFKTAALCLPP